MIAIIAVVLCLLLGLVWYQSGRCRETYVPLEDHAALSRREQEIVAAAANGYFPPDGPIPLSGVDAGMVAYFDLYLRRSAPRQRFLLHLLLVFIELSPFLLGPRRRRFSRSDRAARITYLEESASSSLYFRRLVFTSFRAIMTMAYFAHPDVLAAINCRIDRDPFGLGARAEEGQTRPLAASGPRPKVALVAPAPSSVVGAA
ncbi:MAG: hypothetical protein AAGA56_21740 [Myxococcota bacterium]